MNHTYVDHTYVAQESKLSLLQEQQDTLKSRELHSTQRILRSKFFEPKITKKVCGAILI